MKILQIHNLYRQAGGEDRVALLEAEQLRGAGHDVITHIASNPERRLATLHDLARAPWNSTRAAEMARLVRRTQPDVVHVHNTWFHLSPAIYWAMRSAGAAVVTTMHNFRAVCAGSSLYRDDNTCTECVDQGSSLSAIKHRCYQGSRPLSAVSAATIELSRRKQVWQKDLDAIVVLTNFARELFVQAGLPSDRLHVKPNFTADTGPRTQPPTASNQILFAGRLTAEKGVPNLLEAWSKRPAKGCELHIAGDGPLLAKAQATPDVHALGQVKNGEVAELMASARALVFPSRWFEGLSMTLLEAMAAQLPILASDLGSVPEVLGADYPLLFEPSVDGIADALAQVSSDDQLGSLSQRVRARFEENFTSEKTLHQLEEVYEAAIQRRSQVPA